MLNNGIINEVEKLALKVSFYINKDAVLL